MKWKNISKELPTYYEVVLAELNTGEIVEVWRATDGEFNIWTKFDTDQVYLDEDILRWKKYN